MGLKIFNTMTRKKEDFKPRNPNRTGMYVCGVTVYDYCHIGHARSQVLFDIIFRYLMFKGYEVTYVRNFTDIDDKIINRANELKIDWKELAEKFVREFYVDMDALGVLRPTREPKATEFIAQIQALIAKLVEGKYAYTVDGDVMFSVASFPEYGKLSGKKVDELMSGARVDVNEKKKNPLDFALWKAAKPGEPSWESPWGPGRPGWHIECSAMSMFYLGQHFDIHGGGADLTFPHHENEIAQSEAATGETFVNYWVHNGFVNIRAEKMSKSLGNVLNIRDILKTVHPEALRHFLLTSHYRSPLDYSDAFVKESSTALERLYAAMAALDELIEARGTSDDLPQELTGIEERFSEAMDDDFNTPRALAILFEAARTINRISGTNSVPKPELLREVKDRILHVAREVLGILREDQTEFLERARKAGAPELGISEELIQQYIVERAEARKSKNFARADEIRNELASKGIVLEDTPKGTIWKVKES
ncbi:cysteine--tRNA ligase [Desulfomonile tiedjei]|uniref:Cysteine--tRNA ligase n=1 Tax=Desulfomonile tiedjei (strain ATCC 49306 / DSM 6799 / DCB-1) TaxID=706587 RepID=I4C2L2_DESTA|nr:cysteine--tRNA ligase [Desulfomonile tiedjei]AFM23803.1 cysteinyl-tRNA synthetase [Desulfomonile tiedjei DSM 6799]